MKNKKAKRGNTAKKKFQKRRSRDNSQKKAANHEKNKPGRRKKISAMRRLREKQREREGQQPITVDAATKAFNVQW